MSLRKRSKQTISQTASNSVELRYNHWNSDSGRSKGRSLGSLTPQTIEGAHVAMQRIFNRTKMTTCFETENVLGKGSSK